MWHLHIQWLWLKTSQQCYAGNKKIIPVEPPLPPLSTVLSTALSQCFLLHSCVLILFFLSRNRSERTSFSGLQFLFLVLFIILDSIFSQPFLKNFESNYLKIKLLNNFPILVSYPHTQSYNTNTLYSTNLFCTKKNNKHTSIH
jgi:hypothetical protein